MSRIPFRVRLSSGEVFAAPTMKRKAMNTSSQEAARTVRILSAWSSPLRAKTITPAPNARAPKLCSHHAFCIRRLRRPPDGRGRSSSSSMTNLSLLASCGIRDEGLDARQRFLEAGHRGPEREPDMAHEPRRPPAAPLAWIDVEELAWD